MGETHVIELTRLNSTHLAINSDLIQSIESSPDTTLTLINGEKLVVRESSEKVIELALHYRAKLIAEAARECPGGLVVSSGSLWRANAALLEDAASREEPAASQHAARRREERL
jgi:flagellar protein FlbD